MIKHLLACALAATAGVVEMRSAHADPYTGPSFGKVTCAEYNQLDNNGKIAMWSWIEGYIAGAVRVGLQAKLPRYGQMFNLNYKMIVVIVDGACKADPGLVFEGLAGNLLYRVLEAPDKYR
jgi:hypothetical protein